MPSFHFTANDATGKQKRGSLSASSRGQAITKLAARGLHATEVTIVSDSEEVGAVTPIRLAASGPLIAAPDTAAFVEQPSLQHGDTDPVSTHTAISTTEQSKSVPTISSLVGWTAFASGVLFTLGFVFLLIKPTVFAWVVLGFGAVCLLPVAFIFAGRAGELIGKRLAAERAALQIRRDAAAREQADRRAEEDTALRGRNRSADPAAETEQGRQDAALLLLGIGTKAINPNQTTTVKPPNSGTAYPPERALPLKTKQPHPLRWVVSAVGCLSVCAFILAAVVTGLAILTVDHTMPIGGGFWITLGVLVGAGLLIGLVYVVLRLLVDIAERNKND